MSKFVENAAEYKSLTTNVEKKKLKDESFARWTMYVYLSNSDQNKYGSLMKHFKMQYVLGNNQYYTSISSAKDVLINHTWDDTYKESMKKKSQ